MPSRVWSASELNSAKFGHVPNLCALARGGAEGRYAASPPAIKIIRPCVMGNLGSPTEVEIDFQNGAIVSFNGRVGKIPPRVWSEL